VSGPDGREKQLSLVAHWRNVIRDSGLDRTAKLVALVLSTYMDAGGYAYPSLATLAEGANLGAGCTAVKDGLARIEAAGLLVINRRRGRFGWSYQALIPRAVVGLEAAEIPRGSTSKSHADRTEIPRPGVAESDESAESVSTRADARAGRRKPRVRARDDDKITDPELLGYDE
jgi:hypothetical protein